jgi:hypothetical protein
MIIEVVESISESGYFLYFSRSSRFYGLYLFSPMRLIS